MYTIYALGIGPVAPLTYIVAVRGPGLHLDFRTTDMSMVQVFLLLLSLELFLLFFFLLLL